MKKTFDFRVAHGLQDIRLDKALSEHPDIVSRSHAAKLIQDKHVLLNGKPLKSSHKTAFGDIYQVTIQLEEELELLPYDFPLDIYYEDEELIVVNKPAGLVVHPSAGHMQDTLVNALVHHNKSLSQGSEKQRPGVVHRLDKDTSGLLVVAKTDHSHVHLCEQFRKKTVHRRYWALVFDGFKEKKGTIESYLKRHPNDRKKYASEKLLNYQDPTGKLAITHYEQLNQHTSGISLLQCQLETGRTHQIRVHISESGHPILGDTLYGSNGRLKNMKSVKLRSLIKKMERIGLHARELGFVHPKTNEHIQFTAPWPDDIIELVKELGFDEQV